MRTIGDRIEIYWPSDDAWYAGTLTEVYDGVAKIIYDDGDEEILEDDVLKDETACRVVREGGEEGKDEDDEEEWKEDCEGISLGEAGDELTELDDNYGVEDFELSSSQHHPEGALIPSASSEHLTRQLQKVLDSINIQDFQQEQSDQEEWLQSFLKNQDEVGWDNVEFDDAHTFPTHSSPTRFSPARSSPARTSPVRFNTSPTTSYRGGEVGRGARDG